MNNHDASVVSFINVKKKGEDPRKVLPEKNETKALLTCRQVL